MSLVIWVIFLLSVELFTIVNMAYSVQTGIMVICV